MLSRKRSSSAFATGRVAFLEDAREEHRTHPPTQWFIAQTDTGRRLKVVFVEDVDAGAIHIKTAYESNATEEKIYGQHG